MMTADDNGAAAPRPDFAERVITALVVIGSAFFVFWQLHPDLILSNTTPTGGDMGAHVWGPAFLRDELLPNFRLSGWTPDWYSGFPAFHFYMVIPALLIVILDVGLHPAISIPVVLALAAASMWLRLQGFTRHARQMSIALLVLAPLLIGLPYNIAFKLVAVSGIVMFPVAAWALGHLGGLRFPGPAILSLASLAFAFDRSFNIYGGNIASTLAGEFAASISLSFSLVALGYIIRGTRTGEHRGKAAIFIALTGLCHLLPAFFLLSATLLLMVMRVVQRRWKSIPWLTVAGSTAAMLSAFWVLPFYLRTDYLNDMGWERIEIRHSPLVTRSNLNPADVLSDYPPLPVLLTIAALGLVLSIKNRVELGGLLALTAGLMAIGFLYFPDGRLWNARILPFYYLSVTLLAGVGVGLVVLELLRMRPLIRLAILAGSVILLIPPEIGNAWVWPEPGDDGSYLGGAAGYAVRVLATLTIVAVLGTEIPRQLGRFAGALWIVPSLIALAVLVASPARDVRIGTLDTVEGILWALVLLASIATLLGLVLRVAGSIASPAVRSNPQAIALGGITPPPVPVAAVTPPPVPVAAVTPPPVPVLAEPATTPPPVKISRFAPESERVGRLSAPIVAGAAMFVLLGLALGVLGGTQNTDAGRSWSVAGLDITSDDNSFVTGWARWNFSGLEAKPRVEGSTGDVGQGGYEEYQYVQRTMLGVGEQVGCGRAMWEFAPELNRYGTTMAMMLLPMWTDGCIGSLEGLYFEATPTVPYHFLLQSDLSAPSRKVGVSESVGGPSRAMRDLPYEDFDIDRGVRRLHEMGVRYYLAFSPQTIAAARLHPELEEVTTASPWVVFETRATLVEPLPFSPVVIDGVRNHQDQWLDVGVEWFESLDGVRPASSGPDDWPRVDAEEVVARYAGEDTELAGSIGVDDSPLAELLPVEGVPTTTTVSNVVAETDRISFTVDQVGTPVLVRASYFPTWKAQGAEGPFRVAPNFMVVVPTEPNVELVYSRTSVEWMSIALTVAGLFSLFVLARQSRRR